jgi:nitrite reductase/ring-hydroxylating ferredoxin subunit
MTGVTTEPDDAGNALSRRKMFSMCSLGLLGAAGLAACGSDSSSGAGTTEPAATTDAAGGGAVSLVKLSKVPVAGAIGLEVAGKPVIVSQPTAGDVIGFSAVCPHQFATVAVTDKVLRCPLHGSTFDLATGKNLSGPAAGKPLSPFPVKVVDGEVVQA